MGLFQIIKRRLNPEVGLAELADKIADRAFEAVWQRVSGQVLALAPAEARGYIRARGVVVLRPKFLQIAEQHEVNGVRRAQLYALALETLIHRVQVHAQSLGFPRVVRRAA